MYETLKVIINRNTEEIREQLIVESILLILENGMQTIHDIKFNLNISSIEAIKSLKQLLEKQLIIKQSIGPGMPIYYTIKK